METGFFGEFMMKFQYDDLVRPNAQYYMLSM